MAVLIATILVALALLTVCYHAMPFRSLAAKKPLVAFFPKYKFTFEDHVPVDERLAEQGFRQVKPGVYGRGFWLGDFASALVKTKVVVSGDNARLGSGAMAILFDTGDFWTLANQLKGDS